MEDFDGAGALSERIVELDEGSHRWTMDRIDGRWIPKSLH